VRRGGGARPGLASAGASPIVRQTRLTNDPVCAGGFTVVELLLVVAISVTMLAISIPLTGDALDDQRTRSAATYLSGRIGDARIEAIKRSTRVALRFEPAGWDYRFGEYLDGNGNGVRTADIASGVDRELASRSPLSAQFPGVTFGLLPGLPDLDDQRAMDASDGVRIGSSRILTLGPDGTATSGTLYLHGRQAQFAVRILGATGRTRVLRFDPGGQRWVPK
jgi:type II secretory pathway pseudopilin PulG